jgi:hypothetical protein
MVGPWGALAVTCTSATLQAMAQELGIHSLADKMDAAQGDQDQHMAEN